MSLIDAFEEEYYRFKILANEPPVQAMIHPKTLSELKMEIQDLSMIPIDFKLDVFKLNEVEFEENIEMREGEIKMFGLKPVPGFYELRGKTKKK